MKRDDLQFLLQAAAAELLFLLAVPVISVLLFGTMAKSGLDWGGWKTEVPSGKISTPDTIDVWMEEKGNVVTVDFEAYVCRVTASEMPGSFEEEALKAQSVAARTYAMSKIVRYEEHKPESHPKAPVCSTTHCQVYQTEKKLIEVHEAGWKDSEWKKIQEACRSTEGQLLYYDGELVTQPLFFSSSGGQTENSEDVFSHAYPYLVSVSSPYEEEASHRDEEVVLDIGDFGKRIRKAYPNRELGNIRRENIKILSRTSGGRVAEMQVGDGSEGILKGTEVRTAAGLSSAMFSISFRGEDEIVFTSSGSGHGVGMSQYGADGMAKKGKDYREILTHYYSGTQVY